MIENEEKSEFMDCLGRFWVLFGQALTFARLLKEIQENKGLKRVTKFLPYFEIQNENVLSAEKRAEALSCVKIRLHRTLGEEERYLAAPELAPVPFAAIRGAVYTVRRYSAVHF